MKRIEFGRICGSLLLLGGLLLPALSFAQIEANLDSYTGQNAKGYLMPLKDGFGAALNDGTFRTAAVPKSGFNLNFEIKSMFVKFGDSDDTFTARTEDGFYPSAEVTAPTVVGDTEAVPYIGQGGAEAIFPGGFDIGSIGLAVPQLTIGSVMGTQAVVRYIAVNTGDVEIGDLSLMGFGLRHSISQYFQNPPVDLAVSGFWQKFELGDDLIDSKALTFGVQASKRYSILEPYAGFSMDSFSMSVEYDTEATDPPTRLKVDFGSSSTARFTTGLGINLKFIHLQGELNFADQTSYLLGLSVGN